MAIAIVMATYNGENFISEQIESIIAQSFKDWKLFIHDDGSSDSTLQIISEYEKKDSRIVIENDGIFFHNSSANFFHLLRVIPESFEYICLCDQDDFWNPNKLELSLEEIKKISSDNNLPVCISSDMSLINFSGEIYVKSFWKYANINLNSTFNTLLIENTATGCTMMFNKTVIKYISDLNQDEIKKIIQHDWYISLICASDGIYKQVDVPMVRYRQHGHNVVGARKFNFLNKISLFKLITSIKRIRKLSKKIKEQSIVLEAHINNKENKILAQQYVKTKGVKHKILLFKNGICMDPLYIKKIIKYCFY